MKKHIVLSPLAVGLVVIGFSLSFQCHTTFKHPQVFFEADSTGYYHVEEVTYISDCSRCHEQQVSYAEHQNDIYQSTVYQDKYNWNYFFMTPWWFDDYYYYESRAMTDNNSLEPTQRREFDRRSSSDSARPGQGTPDPSRPSLSKQRSDNPASTSTPQRQDRRGAVSNPSSGQKESTTPEPSRVSRESKPKTSEEKKQNEKEN
ncbi:MAG TPA: hypothetical protein ENN22_01345 [bacterium]|nr:hypothetical protein [bacterium]